MSDSEEVKAKKRAGAMKGVAVKKAKKEASMTGTNIVVPEYGLLVMPDGSVFDLVDPKDKDKTISPQEAAAVQTWSEEPEPKPVHVAPTAVSHEHDIMAAVPEERVQVEPPVDVRAVDLAEVAVPLPEVAQEVPEDKAMDLAGWLDHFMSQGRSEATALALAQDKMREQAPQVSVPENQGVATPENPMDEMAPDPQMVAEYKRRMENYVPPVLDRTYEVTLPVRFADFVERAAQIESARRGRLVDGAFVIDLMVRRAKTTDQDYLAVMDAAAGTGLANTFSPAAGQWQQ